MQNLEQNSRQKLCDPLKTQGNPTGRAEQLVEDELTWVKWRE